MQFDSKAKGALYLLGAGGATLNIFYTLVAFWGHPLQAIVVMFVSGFLAGTFSRSGLDLIRKR